MERFYNKNTLLPLTYMDIVDDYDARNGSNATHILN